MMPRSNKNIDIMFKTFVEKFESLLDTYATLQKFLKATKRLKISPE